MLYKILSGLGVLIFVSFIVTGMIFLSPVEAERLSFGQRSSDKTVKELERRYGLDRSLPDQYGLYLLDLSPLLIIDKEHERLDLYEASILYRWQTKVLIAKWPYLRESYQTGRPVASLLQEVIPLTVILAVLAMSLALVVGIALGLLAAWGHDTWVDQAIVSLSVLGYSLPSYVSAIVFALLFGFFWGPWTGLEVQGSLYELNDLGERVLRPSNLVLPSLALGIRPIGVITQLTRSSALDVMGQQYIRTARAKGLKPWRIWSRHILRNALTPVATASTGWLASMLTGAFFVEAIFNYKGLGFTMVHAMTHFDIPVILACVLLTTLIIVFMNIFIDVIYRWLDPKVGN